MRFYGDIKAFNGVKMGIRNLLVNFFAKKDDNTEFNLYTDDDGNLTISENGVWYTVDNDYNRLKAREVTSNVNATTSLYENGGYYYVGGHYTDGSNVRYLYVLKFDSSFNLVWDAQLNDSSTDYFRGLFFSESYVGIRRRDRLHNLEGFSTLDKTTGNRYKKKIAEWEIGFDEDDLYNYMTHYFGEAITTSSGSEIAPVVIPYIHKEDTRSQRYGGVRIGFYDYDANKFHFLTDMADVSHNENFGVSIQVESKGDYFGGRVYITRGDRLNYSPYFTYARYSHHIVMKANTDGTYNTYSLGWQNVDVYSNDPDYFGGAASINENGDLFGAIVIYGSNTSLTGTQYEGDNYVLLYQMPYGPYDDTNVQQAWMIEKNQSGEGLSVQDIEYDGDYIHIKTSYVDDSSNTIEGYVVLNFNEIMEKDTVDLGRGITLVKAENSPLYNYIVNTANDINLLYAKSYAINTTNATPNFTDDYENLSVNYRTLNYGGTSYTSGAIFDPTQINVASNSSPLNINKSDLKDR